ncbi:hypothetical protein DFJ77DRAFT_147972 [Powellomyces hirtus]|nr:hypothetical protein DFJ77DRAFT_147972 [Powellomyces hirtus]
MVLPILAACTTRIASFSILFLWLSIQFSFVNAAFELSSLVLLKSGGTQCTASSEPAPRETAQQQACDPLKPIAIQPGAPATVAWSWNAPTSEGALGVDLFLDDSTQRIVVARNITPSLLESTFVVPIAAILTPLSIGATQNGTSVLIVSSVTALRAESEVNSSPISRIALILGLCSVFGLALLIFSFFAWRKWIRGRPGYERRKMQRKKGVSTVVADRFKHLWTDSLKRSQNSLKRSWGRAPSNHPTHDTNSPSSQDNGSDGDQLKSMHHQSIAIQPPRPCFRPSTDVLPPRLCKTYTWQETESDQPSSPLRDVAFSEGFDGEDRMLLSDYPVTSSSNSLPMGWDEKARPTIPQAHPTNFAHRQ